ncbi:MAG: hypothetical protein ACRDXX_08160, partial [Stackebrandtia sp.]
HSQGAEPLAVLSDAHIGAQQARGNEALTLVAQGAGTDYEAEFVQIMDELIGPDGDGGVLAEVKADFDDEELTGHVDAAIAAAGEWRSAHEDLRAADDSGDYDTAVASAVGDEVGDAGRAFAALDAALTEANAVAADRFASETDAAGRALGGLGTGVGVITLIAMIAAALGLQRRISEYR